MPGAAKPKSKPAAEKLPAISRPDKVLFPKDGITKRDLVDYYERIASVMLPYLRDRPISMQRYPDGIASEGFFQKKAGRYFPQWIKTATLAKQGGTVRHVICDDAATLVYLAGQAVITPHAWLSRADKPNHPDQLIFDLDPSQKDFHVVCAAARALRDLLRGRGLTSFVKTTGSRGLHVLVPLNRAREFDAVRAFAREIAEELAEGNPKELTTDVRKDKRAGRVFIDVARNAYAQTAAPAYAVRPRDGAPVAAPLHWEELDGSSLKPDQFNIRNVFDRLHAVGDPWKHLGKHAQALPR
ncbi:MAG TPA: non-homologous end-joining DNA ligase [Bryobacteraceae bacterium]|nr:non-homologous end-joining DNA ligase [Bryobacteraceae bacterium]